MRRAFAGLGLVLSVLTACSSKAPLGPLPAPGSDAGPVDPKACRVCTFGDPEDAGVIDREELDELSGLAASRVHEGVLYTHNDSGDLARFFGIDERGVVHAEHTLEGITTEDTEDIAVGPCASGSCVFLGDIGDNDEKRKDVRIYRMPEPGITSDTLRPEVLVAKYPDGPHNAETLLVLPKSGAAGSAGDMIIVTKSPSGVSGVYRLPAEAQPGTTHVLEKKGELVVPDTGSPLVTGGSVHPCEDRILIRTYATLFEYRFSGGLETAFAAAPTVLPVSKEPQGEAVTYSADGTHVFTVSEGKRPTLHRKDCL